VDIIPLGMSLEEFEERMGTVSALQLGEHLLSLQSTLLLLVRSPQLPCIIEIVPVDIGLHLMNLVRLPHLKATSSPI
jgi:hypothetical protein